MLLGYKCYDSFLMHLEQNGAVACNSVPPVTQHGVRYLTRRSDIRDALVESFLTRRQQHRRQRPEQRFSVHRL